MPGVTLERITKRFEHTPAVNGVSLAIREGELFTLLGPSGCGKTTLLRLLAGLEQPDEGQIWFGDVRVDQEPPYRRNIGMVFQSYAIFPHMSVAENVAYGLRSRRLPEADVRERVLDALEQVELAGYGDRRPDQLSGGQQQRVALARALATRPELLLMDEPLSNLDARLRLTMREEIRRLQKHTGITTVYVTHDQEEALAISDRVAVMRDGRLQQVGTPFEIYARPVSKQVASFVGQCSFIRAEVKAGRILAGGKRFDRELKDGYEGEALLGFRPQALEPLPEDWELPGGVLLQAQVLDEIFLGAHVNVRARLDTGETVTALSAHPPGTFPPGTRVVLACRPESALLFNPSGEGALR